MRPCASMRVLPMEEVAIWIASATPATLRTRCGTTWERGGMIRGEVEEGGSTYLSRSGEHTLTRVKSCARGILDFLNLRTLFPNDGTHARIGDHEFNSYC